jgi:CRISPR system Cascade subunit CasA
MNLLIDTWIPIRRGADFQQISFKELLCSEQPDIQVALPRDDLELACIQMLAALTQVIFMPKDKKELRERVKTPLSEREYENGVENHKEWFDLDHPKWPFMQVRGVEGEWTSIQKLMIGMPEITSKSGSAHAFFNEPTEVLALSPGIAAIALFNQAGNSPSFGGGFKGSLRGAGPISTMVMGRNLRDTTWSNVLPIEKVKELLPWHDATKDTDMPVWVKPIPNGTIQPHGIGLLRGLFWQPANMELVKADKTLCCDITDKKGKGFYVGFKKKRFSFDLEGVWPHPYSPRQFEADGTVKYLAFKGNDPAWMQLTEFLFSSGGAGQPGYSSASVVQQHTDNSINLLVGGYKVEKGASIVYRRHELYALPAGWSDDFKDRISEITETCFDAIKILSDKVLYPVSKGSKESGLKGVGVPFKSQAQTLFYHLTEPLIHSMLHDSSLREFAKAKGLFLENLSRICMDIFERVTKPYANKPEIIGIVALGRVKLRKLLNNLIKEHTVTGGAA